MLVLMRQSLFYSSNKVEYYTIIMFRKKCTNENAYRGEQGIYEIFR